MNDENERKTVFSLRFRNEELQTEQKLVDRPYNLKHCKTCDESEAGDDNDDDDDKKITSTFGISASQPRTMQCKERNE